MNQERLGELEDLQFEIHALLDAKQSGAEDEQSATAIEVLAAALSHEPRGDCGRRSGFVDDCFRCQSGPA